MKINKINKDNILSYDEIITKYNIELNSNEISQEVLDNTIAMVIDHKNDIEHRYEFIIEQIYLAIIEFEYLEYPNGYIESIFKLVKYIFYLNIDKNLNSDMDCIDLNKLCIKVYNKLASCNAYDKYINIENMNDEFKLESILNVDYQLNNLKKYTNNEKILNELNKDEWRAL